MRESELLREILLAVSRIRMPNGSAACVLWRQQVGVFETRDGRTVKVGVEGQADLGGLLANGRAIQVEVKSPTGRLRDQQAKWREMVLRMGGVYVLARRVEDVTDAIRGAVKP